MSDFKYALELDPSVRTNHTVMLELIGHNKRVLECGCATGYMSRVLTERGCRVTGIEIAPAAAEQARAFCERVIVGDLDELDLAAAVDPDLHGPQPFEVVVFGDVLEHLKDPLRVLRASRSLLAPEGYVVASIPNVAHGDVRLSLLKGTFRYQPLGLLDDTHIRFFTRESIGELFESAGFVVSEVERMMVDLFGTELPVSADEFSAEILERVEADPESRTYQFVVRALVDNGLDVVRKLAARDEARELQLLANQRELASHRTQNAGLAQDRDRWLAQAQASQAEVDRLTTLALGMEEDRDRLVALDEQRRGETELLGSRMAALEEQLREAESALERLRSERDEWRSAAERRLVATTPAVARAARMVWRRTPEAARRLAGPALRRIRSALRPGGEEPDGPWRPEP
jgi:2-polyprenyl-3-methyl-5-hydroxy-6-metoxy-1,4-benzoquinol methylase